MKISSKNLISINLWLLIIVFIGILVINGLGIEFSYAQGSCASPPPGPEIRFFEEFYETTCEAEDLGGVCPCPEKRNEAYVTVYAVYKYVCLSGEWEYERDRFDFEIVQQCPEGGSGGGEAGCGDCTLYYEDPAPEGCGWVRPPSTSCVNPGLCAIRATYDCVNDSTWEDTGCICEGGGGGPRLHRHPALTCLVRPLLKFPIQLFFPGILPILILAPLPATGAAVSRPAVLKQLPWEGELILLLFLVPAPAAHLLIALPFKLFKCRNALSGPIPPTLSFLKFPIFDGPANTPIPAPLIRESALSAPLKPNVPLTLLLSGLNKPLFTT